MFKWELLFIHLQSLKKNNYTMAWSNFVKDLSRFIFCGKVIKSTDGSPNIESQQIQLPLTAVQQFC